MRQKRFTFPSVTGMSSGQSTRWAHELPSEGETKIEGDENINSCLYHVKLLRACSKCRLFWLGRLWVTGNEGRLFPSNNTYCFIRISLLTNCIFFLSKLSHCFLLTYCSSSLSLLRAVLVIGHVRYTNIFHVSFVPQFPKETWIQRKQHQI